MPIHQYVYLGAFTQPVALATDLYILFILPQYYVSLFYFFPHLFDIASVCIHVVSTT